MDIPHDHQEQDEKDHMAKQDALTWALNMWLENATYDDEPEIVLAPRDFPDSFVGLMEVITRHQSERIQEKLAVLTSGKPLISLAL